MSTQPRYDLSIHTAEDNAAYRAYWLSPVGLVRWIGMMAVPLARPRVGGGTRPGYIPKRLAALASEGDPEIIAAMTWVSKHAELLLIEAANFGPGNEVAP